MLIFSILFETLSLLVSPENIDVVESNLHLSNPCFKSQLQEEAENFLKVGHGDGSGREVRRGMPS